MSRSIFDLFAEMPFMGNGSGVREWHRSWLAACRANSLQLARDAHCPVAVQSSSDMAFAKRAIAHAVAIGRAMPDRIRSPKGLPGGIWISCQNLRLPPSRLGRSLV